MWRNTLPRLVLILWMMNQVIWMVIINDFVMRSDQVSDNILCRTALVDKEKESDGFVYVVTKQAAHCLWTGGASMNESFIA